MSTYYPPRLDLQSIVPRTLLATQFTIYAGVVYTREQGLVLVPGSRPCSSWLVGVRTFLSLELRHVRHCGNRNLGDD
jgi:hypothetical protein